jgi:predicted enzyme related to lactoylglutathione lyase
VVAESVSHLKRYLALLFRCRHPEWEQAMPKDPSNFIWYELMTTDLDAAARFYGAVVGWSVQASNQPGIDYRQWSIDGEPIGGLLAISANAAANGMRPLWLGYVNVANIDSSIDNINQAGGAVLMPTTEIAGVGRIAMVADPQGAAIYLMTPAGIGPSHSFAPGRHGHGGWHELHTSDWRAALSFYSTHLGWGQSEAMDMGPMGTYLLFNAGGEAIGGIMNSPNFPRPMWLYYFCVDNIDATRTRLESAGGTVLNGPMEVPGGSWIIQAKDPQGAMFALVGPRKA